jgi:hypothetical protein
MRNLYYLTYLLWLVLGLGTHAALAQTQRVTGKVTTADGKEELPGVTVLLKGTNPIPQTHLERITRNGQPLSSTERQAEQNPGY